jgi:hypothetical protein
MNRKIVSAIGVLAFTCYSTISQAGVTYFNCSSPTTTDATVDSRTGDTTARGTIVCSKGDSQPIGAQLLQTTPLSVSLGSTRLVCTGGSDVWEVPGQSFVGKIEPRNATLSCWAGDNQFDPKAPKDQGTVTVREKPIEPAR